MDDNKQSIHLNINGEPLIVDAAPDTPLLWVLRDKLNLTGTKYGCGIGLCGSCTVLIDGVATRSCKLLVSRLGNRNILTIEGLDAHARHPLQRAWIEEDVPQCGYCQAGQIMTAFALLKRNARPSVSDIRDAMAPVVCRCGTYQRIQKAIQRAAEYMAEEGAAP